MSDLFEHEIVLEEPGEPSARPKGGVAGIVVGVVGLMLSWRRTAAFGPVS